MQKFKRFREEFFAPLPLIFHYFLISFLSFTLQADDQRMKILEKTRVKGFIASAKALEIENPEEPDSEELLRKYKAAHHNRDDFQLKALDNEMKSVSEELSSAIQQ